MGLSLKQDFNPKEQIWHELRRYYEQTKTVHMRDLFGSDAARFDKFSLELDGLFVDYSKNRITKTGLDFLIALAKACNLKDKINDLFAGKKVNFTEKLAAVHPAYRDFSAKPLIIDGEDLKLSIKKEQDKLKNITNLLRAGEYQANSNNKITDIVNIGIGGSNLGPQILCDALKFYKDTNINTHFVSSIDSADLYSKLNNLNPKNTLFVIISKSFTTTETILNAKSAKNWLQEKLGQDVSKHFVAITAKPNLAEDFGVSPGNIFAISKHLGGRFSISSSVAFLPIVMMGWDNYIKFLQGANTIDKHFQSAKFNENIPVILALLDIWYCDFYKAETRVILPYNKNMMRFSDYLQQLVMESNGKSVTRDNELVSYPTSAIIWGQSGCDSQHAFNQLLLQGTHLIPTDFLISASDDYNNKTHHDLLIANCLGQSRALMFGETISEAGVSLSTKELSQEALGVLAKHKAISGNQPSNTFIFPKLNPYYLGMLIAMYEHKVYVQSVIWDINAFDQWGVELGKQLASHLEKHYNREDKRPIFDASTNGLMARLAKYS